MTEIEIILLLLIIACFAFICGIILRMYFTIKDNDELSKDLYRLEKDLVILRKRFNSYMNENNKRSDKPQEETQPQDDGVLHKVKIEVAEDTGLKDYEPDPRYKKLHGKDYYNFIIDEANEFLNEQEQGKRLRLQDQDYVWVNVDTIKDCIDLLSTDGKGTKQQVKEKLEGLLK